MADDPGTTKKVKPNSSALATLPKDWRTTLPKRVGELPFPDLGNAVAAATEILAGRSDAEVQQITDHLWQLISKDAPVTSTSGGPDDQGYVNPHIIYFLHTPLEAEPALDFAALRNDLAIATLFALVRACDAFSAAHDGPSWVTAAQAIANARALSEWIYVAHTLLPRVGQANKSASLQNIRAAVKAKIKKTKSEAAKKGWRKELKPDKELVFGYYEQHKSEFKSLAKAASAIASKKLVNQGYSTIYTWLRKYVKKLAK